MENVEENTKNFMPNYNSKNYTRRPKVLKNLNEMQISIYEKSLNPLLHKAKKLKPKDLKNLEHYIKEEMNKIKIVDISPKKKPNFFQIEKRCDYELINGTYIFEGYFDEKEDFQYKFCRFEQIDLTENIDFKKFALTKNEKFYDKNEINKKWGVPKFSYFCGYWHSKTLFKGMRISHCGTKAQLGHFLYLQNPFTLLKSKALYLTGTGIEILTNVNHLETFKCYKGYFLYSKRHTFCPRNLTVLESGKDQEECGTEKTQDSRNLKPVEYIVSGYF